MLEEHFFLQDGWTGITALSFKNVQSPVEPFPVRFQLPNIWAENSLTGQYCCGSQRLSTAVMNSAGMLLLIWTLLHSKDSAAAQRKVTSRSTMLNRMKTFFGINKWPLFFCSRQSRKHKWHHTRYVMQHTKHTLHWEVLQVTNRI